MRLRSLANSVADASYSTFRLKPVVAKKPRQLWLNPVPPKKVIQITDLDDSQEYAFFRFYDGRLQIVTAFGATLKRKWAACVRRDKLDRFIAAYFVRPKIARFKKPHGLWREVLLTPRKDLFFSVQPVLKRYYGKKRKVGSY